MAESSEQRARAHGRLTEKEQAEAGKNHAEREDMPAGVFLEPSARKYPVKEERDGKWVYSRDLLLAAAREARMHGYDDLADRADAIRKREFGGADDIALDAKSVRTFDEDGRLHVESTPISKAVINEYYGHEIPDARRLGLEAQRKYKLLRHPEELKSAADTFNNIPVMIQHVRQSADDPQKDKVVGSTGTDAKFDHPHLKNSLVVWDKDAIDGIKDNSRRQLSCSYRYEADMTPGHFEGEWYDGVMRKLRGNHVALVPEGRAGSDVLVEDSLPAKLKDSKMKQSRRALVAQGALAGWLAPKLAADAKLPDLRHVLLGVTAANWDQAKPAIIGRLNEAMSGKLAQDASIRDAARFLDALAFDQVDPEEEDDADLPDNGEDESDDPNERHGTEEANADKKARDKRAKDKRAKDKKARDALENLSMRENGEGKEKLGSFDEEPESEEDMDKRQKKEAADARRARDRGDSCDESEEDMDKRHRKEASDAKRARDRRAADMARAADEEKEKRERERAEDRRANDAAIRNAIAANDRRHREIREAEQFVRPWVGELALAQDSAESVYRLALDTLGVDHRGKHPDALKDILAVQPRPGDRPMRQQQFANDSAAVSDFAKRFPNLAAVRRV